MSNLLTFLIVNGFYKQSTKISFVYIDLQHSYQSIVLFKIQKVEIMFSTKTKGFIFNNQFSFKNILKRKETLADLLSDSSSKIYPALK